MRLCFRPMYSGSLSRRSLSVPMSSTIGITRAGLKPAAATYRSSLPARAAGFQELQGHGFTSMLTTPCGTAAFCTGLACDLPAARLP